MSISLRTYTPVDLGEVLAILYAAVHALPDADYTPAERDAWAPSVRDATAFHRSLVQNYALVAEADGVLAGFGDIDDAGYLDRLFVRPDMQRRGIASLLADELEEHARTGGLDVVTARVSVSARPFFLGRGYRIRAKQFVERAGEQLTCFDMEKLLFLDPDDILWADD
ncbi:GNAT family N-acetyltransferase [Oscillospiraceae bacterium OttesenSCG-928-G22]|nr:GNAT family N-acetyltransferase [Oscillospiraceae bacterium OttesenSCG-928-G22]